MVYDSAGGTITQELREQSVGKKRKEEKRGENLSVRVKSKVGSLR